MSPGKPSSPSSYSLPFQNVFPCTVVVGSALFFERVVREWRVGRECPRQHTEHVIMMEMKILTFDKHVVVKRRGNSRVEICRDRRDRWSCKICANCVIFPGEQCDFSQNLRRIQDLHTPSVLKLLKFYTIS